MAGRTDCLDCTLRCRRIFVPMAAEELAFMRRFKSGELVVAARSEFMSQGQSSPVLLTVLSVMALRSTLLENGRPQAISFVFPGGLIGLPAGLMGEARHGVTAVSDMVLCSFARDRMWELFTLQPARSTTWPGRWCGSGGGSLPSGWRQGGGWHGPLPVPAT